MQGPYITLYPLIGYFTLRVANAINSWILFRMGLEYCQRFSVNFLDLINGIYQRPDSINALFLKV